MLEKALRLCDAAVGQLLRFDGERFHILAARHAGGKEVKFSYDPIVPDKGSTLKRMAEGETLVHIADVIDTEAYRSGVASRLRLVDETGARTALWVALPKDEDLLGVFVVYRQEVRPFSDKQISLLQNFAAQAVIAMENARLITETRDHTRDLQEALEFQTATSNVLNVISRSTFNLQPVLDTLIETAVRLCGADLGHLSMLHGDVCRPAATFACSPEFEAFLHGLSFSPGRGTVVGRAIIERQSVQIADVAADANYSIREPVITVGRVRCVLGVPLMRNEEPIGVLALARQCVMPFTERQIELVRTFADQAVIAIENARLIDETREALEQQTATAEVLGVINSSPGDLAPVFDVMLEKATRLCEAAFGMMSTYDGECFHGVAGHNVPSAYVEYLAHNPPQPSPESALGRIRSGERVVHIEDYAQYQANSEDNPRQRALVGTWRCPKLYRRGFV